MLSDFDILGIAPTHDSTLIKRAFRKRIKEIHPDHSAEDEAFRNHLLFIQVNQAYTRLMSQTEKTEAGTAHPAIRPARTDAMPGATALAKHSDPAYVFYKTGVDYFRRIHPSAWNDMRSALQTPIPGDVSREQQELKKRVAELTKLFPKAYYYFSIVAHEYPESMWSADAREKMSLIEERTQRYKRIIDSFR